MGALNRRRQPNRRPLEAPTPDLMAWAAERLGPMPGRWAGWADPIEGSTREAWARVGYIHGMSAETGRGLQAIGQTLQQLQAQADRLHCFPSSLARTLIVQGLDQLAAATTTRGVA